MSCVAVLRPSFGAYVRLADLRFDPNTMNIKGTVLDIDLYETVGNFLTSATGYKSNTEPLAIQFLTTGMAMGCRIVPYSVGLEVGSCKTIAMLAILESITYLAKNGVIEKDLRDKLISVPDIAKDPDATLEK